MTAEVPCTCSELISGLGYLSGGEGFSCDVPVSSVH